MTDVVDFYIYAPPTRYGAVLRGIIVDVLTELRMHFEARDIEIDNKRNKSVEIRD